MKIYSWNMLYRNKRLDEAFTFVSKSDFDIFCLQEVPVEFLARLRTLPFHLAETIDVERLLGEVKRNHLVILSRNAIKNQSVIPFPNYWPLLPWRTHLFVRSMRPWFWSKIQNRSALYVDSMVGERLVRVFNLHTAITRVDWRIREFEQTMAERDPTLPTIVCGDFNVMESPKVSILNWLVGGKIGDALRFTRERTRLEKHFVEHELMNPLRGVTTHPFSRSQLDHILVSNSFSIQNALVLNDRHGSDHHPISVEIL